MKACIGAMCVGMRLHALKKNIAIYANTSYGVYLQKNMNAGKMRFGVCSLCAEESKEEFCVSEKRAIVYAKTSYGLLLRKRTLECVKA